MAFATRNRPHLGNGPLAVVVIAATIAACLLVLFTGCGRVEAQAQRGAVVSGSTYLSGGSTAAPLRRGVRAVRRAPIGPGYDFTSQSFPPRRALSAAPLIPGVDYSPLPGARSLAGTSHGHPAAPLNTACDPWAAGGFNRDLMACRYGPHWASGAPGQHSNVFADELHQRCLDRTGRWSTPAELARRDCVPHPRDEADAYYTQDSRVRPVVVRPTPTPRPTATPPPPPAPTPAPTPPTTGRRTGPCPFVEATCPACPPCYLPDPCPTTTCPPTPTPAPEPTPAPTPLRCPAECADLGVFGGVRTCACDVPCPDETCATYKRVDEPEYVRLTIEAGLDRLGRRFREQVALTRRWRAENPGPHYSLLSSGRISQSLESMEWNCYPVKGGEECQAADALPGEVPAFVPRSPYAVQPMRCGV